MRRIPVAIVAVALMLVVPALPAHGGGGVGLPMSYTTMCQYGERVVVWTLTNDAFGPDDDITVETFDLITDPAGPALTTTAFEPQPIPRWSSAQSTTRLPGTYLGEIRGSISVRAEESGGGAQRLIPTVALTQRCPGVGGIEGTTISSTSPATTAAPTAIAAQPTFTG